MQQKPGALALELAGELNPDLALHWPGCFWEPQFPSGVSPRMTGGLCRAWHTQVLQKLAAAIIIIITPGTVSITIVASDRILSVDSTTSSGDRACKDVHKTSVALCWKCLTLRLGKSLNRLELLPSTLNLTEKVSMRFTRLL